MYICNGLVLHFRHIFKPHNVVKHFKKKNMKKLELIAITFCLLILTNCSDDNIDNNDNNQISLEKLHANIGNQRLVEISLIDGSESLITNFQSSNDALDDILFLNNEFIGTKPDGSNTLIKKINTSTGGSVTLTTINNFVDLIK